MCKVVIQPMFRSSLTDPVVVPEWVHDRATFLRWTESADFPEGGRIDYLAREVWIDMSEEQVFSHNQVKTELTRVLAGLARAERMGRYFADGLRIEHPEADLVAVPDGVFLANPTIETMRVRFVKGAQSGFTRVEGSPDLVVEVLSDSSVKKDTEELRSLYHKAGIPEYWLIDARSESLRFDVLRRTDRGYVAARKKDGWVSSAVLGKSFRLTQRPDLLGHPEYTLEVK
jgi:Uma2 family endonuclease